jgi:hypothetical protein
VRQSASDLNELQSAENDFAAHAILPNRLPQDLPCPLTRSPVRECDCGSARAAMHRLLLFRILLLLRRIQTLIDRLMYLRQSASLFRMLNACLEICVLHRSTFVRLAGTMRLLS